MDCQLDTLSHDENHHLEQVPRAIRSDDEPTVWIFSGVLDRERMVNGVMDVFIGDAMLASRRVNLHDL